MKETTMKHDDAVRKDAVGRVLGGTPVEQVASELNICAVTVYNWLRAAGYKVQRLTRWVKA